MKWVFYNAREAFPRYEGLWNEINRAQGNHILLDSQFVGALVRHFASEQTLLGISDNSSPSLVIVDRSRNGFWQTFQPAQSPLGLILISDGKTVIEQIESLIRELPGYALGFAVLQQDPDFSAFYDLSVTPKMDTIDYVKTSRITLQGCFKQYWQRLGRYYVDDLRRQDRRLSERGVELKLVIQRNEENVNDCIREHGRLEETGWKGKQGTAITADNRQGMFYREILQAFCTQEEGVIYQLLFNGKIVASDLCLERNGMLIVLKIAYDESLKGLSPGKLLHREMLQSLFNAGNIKVLEWYGRLHDWQIKLGSEPRTMYHLNFYRYRWVAVARRHVKTALGLYNGWLRRCGITGRTLPGPETASGS